MPRSQNSEHKYDTSVGLEARCLFGEATAESFSSTAINGVTDSAVRPLSRKVETQSVVKKQFSAAGTLWDHRMFILPGCKYSFASQCWPVCMLKSIPIPGRCRQRGSLECQGQILHQQQMANLKELRAFASLAIACRENLVVVAQKCRSHGLQVGRRRKRPGAVVRFSRASQGENRYLAELERTRGKGPWFQRLRLSV